MKNQTYAQTDIVESPVAAAWVYILYNTISGETNIGLSFNPGKTLGRINNTENLVYYRSFSNPFDALAHKHLFDTLSIESVMHNIKKDNPTLSKLKF